MFFQRYMCDATLVIRAPVGMKGRRWGTPWRMAAGGGGASEEEDKVQSLSLRELLVHRNPLPLVYLALVYQWSS